jgi:hypothetical protein
MFSFASQAQAIVTDYSATSSNTNAGRMTVASISLNTFNSTTLGPGSNLYNTIAAQFTVDTNGSYDIETTSANFDTVILFYNGAFSSSNPSQNLGAGNDDTTNSNICSPTSTANRCSKVTQTLATGTTYTLVVTTFSNNTTIGFPVGIRATGPGNATFTAFTTPSAPVAPTNVGATAGAGQATVTFTAPRSNGGVAITGYTATTTTSAVVRTGTCSGAAACSITVTGLERGISYRFSVKATNSIGDSPLSDESNTIKIETDAPPPLPPPFLGNASDVTPINFTLTPTPGSSGGTTATAKLPSTVLSDANGPLTVTVAAKPIVAPSDGPKVLVTTGKSADGHAGIVFLRPDGSVLFTVYYDEKLHGMTMTSGGSYVARLGQRISTVKGKTTVIKTSKSDTANAIPVQTPYQVTPPKALIFSTDISLTGTDANGNSGTITFPITLYAPTAPTDLTAISVDKYGNFGKAASSAPVFSRDGQVMSFTSSDMNFGISSASGTTQAMRYAVPLGTIDLISQSTFMGSMGGNASYGGSSLSPALSADGKVLAFASDAINIYPFYPSPKGRQIYLTLGNTAMIGNTMPSPVPLALNGFASIGSMDKPALNADATIIAFESTYGWVPSGSTGAKQIYVKNTVSGTYTLASSDASGNPGNADSSNASISDDGRFVLFETDATNLGGSPNVRQIYLKDMTTGAITLISAGTNGQPGNAISTNAKLSGIVSYTGTGLIAAFESDATNLVAATVSGRQVYRRDISAKVTALVSATLSGKAVGGSNAGISGDGRFVVYKSARDVGASVAGSTQIYVYDAFARTTAIISTDSDGLPGNAASDAPTISADGRSIGFTSLANNLDGTATNGVSQAYIAANPLDVPLANGFWVNPNSSGQYYAVEQSGNKVWFAAFGFNTDTTPNWTFAAENALTSNSFTGSLLQTSNGPVLAGTGGPATISDNLGSTSLTVAGQTSASLTLPAGASTIQRNDFVTGGSSGGQVAGYPETGWWYAPSTNQSLFLEVQGTSLFATIPSYAPTGRPTWYQTKGDMSSASTYSGTLNASCTSPFCTTSAGTVSLAFASTLAGTITLPGGKPLAIQRWRF